MYKISPDYGNPEIDERVYQLDLSVELLKREIDEIKPKFCIILTNEEWWKPFREKLEQKKLEHNSGPEVISFEEYNDTKIILTTRPFSGSHEKHVSQILKLTERAK
ncbi:MAG: hypothetical protein SGJ10_05045 [Bacteroidota bacterium]|nr:hypothetical protein [Bacteroidota bacterium]